jgi:16S rRNA (cytosine967-C5)-methyltransferase
MARQAAWQVLRSGAPFPLREVDRVARERGLDARDRALVRHLIGTEVRRRGTLRALVRHLARTKPKPDLAAHLHLGLVQLFFLDRVPDHAAVSATSDAVARTLGGSRVPIANGILRSAIRLRREGASGDPRRDLVGRALHTAEPIFRDPAEHPLLWAEDALSMPAHLVKRWAHRHGLERALALARQALAAPPLAVRAVSGTRAALQAELEAAGAEPRPAAAHPDVVLVPARRAERVATSAAVREGRATIQGASALAAAELVGARAGERVLDLCAAPGGKTAVLSAAGARVVAVDRSSKRLARARETLARLHQEERARLVASDGTRALARAARFERALVDAPCSNTGVLAARPSARWRLGPASLRSLAALQERLLADAAERVVPGGTLVWSTCSLEPEENGQRVRAFLHAHPEWSLAEERESLPGEDGDPPDGGYAARLVRA